MRRKDADMTQGVIWKQFVAFSVPMAIGLLFQQMYNTVDTLSTTSPTPCTIGPPYPALFVPHTLHHLSPIHCTICPP